MAKEETFHRFDQFLEQLPENYFILEEQIDLDVQRAFFQAAERSVDPISDEEIEEASVILEDANGDVEEKKRSLSRLGVSAKVVAFRVLKKYMENPDPIIRDWALLAYKECELGLQNEILGEETVFISSGLGGKGKMLRYFVVLFHKEEEDFEPFQAQLVENEVTYGLRQNGGEIESLEIQGSFVKVICLFDIHVDIREVFRSVVQECNELGNFMDQQVLMTNVLILTDEEILEIRHQKEEDESKEPTD